MGVYIKGMEMPKTCYDCYFCRTYDEPNQGYFCIPLFADLHRTDFIKKRIDACPLIELPPHGRLIDADALVEILLKVIDINASIEQRNEATEQERRCLWWFEQQIGIAPTIIPAEEDE